MYNLLVSYGGWASTRDTLGADRAFEFTESHIADRFKPNGELDTHALMRLPTLFMQERDSGDFQARVGNLLRVVSSRQDLTIEYVFSPGLPTLPESRVESLALELGIGKFEFTRTHWAVKDVDLFEVLYRHVQPRKPSASVFRLNDPEEIDDDLIAVMMPFDSDFDDVYAAIGRASDAVGLRCRRADDIWDHPAIIQDVVTLIDRARIVICDCTGRNPNVFYEAGIAHTLGRDVILITQSKDDIPFDIRHLRHLQYLNNGEGLGELADRLKDRLGR